MTSTSDESHTTQTKPITKPSDSENKFLFARDLISHQRLITVDVNQTLDKALQLMLQYDIRHLPVVDSSKENEPLVGVITERDMRLVAASPVIDPDIHLKEMIAILKEHKIGEAMQKSLYTISDDESILAACKIMRLCKKGVLPVLEKDTNRLVGVITQTDLLDHLIRVLEPLEQSSES